MNMKDDNFKSFVNYLWEMKKATNSVFEKFSPLYSHVNKVANQAETLFSLQDSFQKAIIPHIEKQKQLAGLLEKRDTFAHQVSEILKPTIEFHDNVLKAISPAFERFEKILKELPQKTKEALIRLAEHGWFFDLEMTIPKLRRLHNAIKIGEVEDAEIALEEYFESRINNIETSLTEKYPNRAAIIKSAIKAHQSGEYNLSIPVFIAQADGICYEVIDNHFFLKKDKKPKTAIFVESIAAETYKAALMAPLAQSLPISYSEKERGDNFNELNRHTVLHGECLDYGTQRNSLKSLSLLNYVGHILKLENP